jgi:hypothetical protein
MFIQPVRRSSKASLSILTRGSACVQALATGNLDQAPPEFRDVLVPLHVRFPASCSLPCKYDCICGVHAMALLQADSNRMHNGMHGQRS